MKRWLTVFFALQILLLVSGGAGACSWDRTVTDQERFRAARSVFIAHVMRTEEVERSAADQDEPMIQATVRVLESFKGLPPADGKIRSRVFGGGNCTIPILAGNDYLIFLRDDLPVSFPGGSRLLSSLRDDLQDEETKQILKMLRRLRDDRSP